VDLDEAFMRCAQALFESLVTEDSYTIDGIYYPHISRYSTILLNIESMGIAWPVLVESRSFTSSGGNRTYSYVLRNYNNTIWIHPEEEM
jgi:hypothetical protein